MSFLLVIVATVFLVAGLFLTKQDLTLIFVSIGCSALAGLVLIVAVLRSRPRQVETPAAGGPAQASAGSGKAEDTAAARLPMSAPSRPVDPDFPIAGYDELEVVEVLPLLGELEPADLEMVRQREASGRAHPWILARVDALLESEADTGEGEWAPSRWASAGTGTAEADTDADAEAAEADEFDEFDEIEEVEPEPGWDRSPEAAEWAATDFPLDESEVSTYEDVEMGGGTFPIDRYDELRASDILRLLPDLHPEDLKLVRQEEASGKARTSILSRIDVLLARDLPPEKPGPRPAKRAVKATRAGTALPIEDYDSLTVPQITARLAALTAAELKQLRAYERRHKSRLGVLQKIDGALLRATR